MSWLLEPVPDFYDGPCDRWVVYGLGVARVQLSDVHEADARLVAAAPDLLAAAEAVLEHASAVNLDALRSAVRAARRSDGVRNGLGENQAVVSAAFRQELAARRLEGV
jgi:hypothetical protein